MHISLLSSQIRQRFRFSYVIYRTVHIYVWYHNQEKHVLWLFNKRTKYFKYWEINDEVRKSSSRLNTCSNFKMHTKLQRKSVSQFFLEITTLNLFYVIYNWQATFGIGSFPKKKCIKNTKSTYRRIPGELPHPVDQPHGVVRRLRVRRHAQG